MRYKSRGRWRIWTWRQLADEVELFSVGLARLGFGTGDALAVLGDIEPRQIVAVLATHRLGGAVVPVDSAWQDAELDAVLKTARVRFAYAADQKEVDRLLVLPVADASQAARSKPTLGAIIYGAGRGLRGYGDPRLHTYESVATLSGRVFIAAEKDVGPGGFSDAADNTQRDDLVNDRRTDDNDDDTPASLTAFGFWSVDGAGRTRGVWISQGHVLAAARQTSAAIAAATSDESIALSSLSWHPNALIFAEWQLVGFRLNCPEPGGNPEIDRRQIAPTYLFAPSGWYLTLWHDVNARLPISGTWRRRLIDATLNLLARAHDRGRQHHRTAWPERQLCRLARLLVSKPLAASLGLGRVRVAVAVGQTFDRQQQTLLSALGIRTHHVAGIHQVDAFPSVAT